MSEATASPATEPGTPDPQPEPELQLLFFHVGLPKSGSTYLQNVLGTHRAAPREVGHVYPYVRQEGMFHAAVEMAGQPSRWGLEPEAIRGTFAHLPRRGRRIGGTVLVSHEIFGSASEVQIAHMAPLLERFEVHLVLTARDLGRTVTAEWQEQVKNGNPRSFEAFVDDLMSHLPPDAGDASSFWPTQNLRTVLDRWEALVPAQRIHIVTCPRAGAAPDLLWRRFAEAVELPHDAVDLSLIPPRNESLGTAQIALLRRVVSALDGRLQQPGFSRTAKRWFAQTLLGGVAGSAKPVTPAPVAQRLAAVSSAWVEVIRAGDFQVHGDLDELLPEPGDPLTAHPDDVTDAELLDGLPEVVAEMLLRTGKLQHQVDELTSRTESLTHERDQQAERADGLAAELEELSSKWFPRWASRERTGDDGARRS